MQNARSPPAFLPVSENGVVIESAEDFKRLVESGDPAERLQALSVEASEAIWLDVIAEFPQHRRDVARVRSVPYPVLAALRNDPDESVQWAVRVRQEWLEHHPEDAEPWLDDPGREVQISLADDERFLLSRGLIEWGGPARCTQEMAVAMGFESVDDLFVQSDRLIEALEARHALSRTDWTRVLLATEVVFASNILGAGRDWAIATGIDDVKAVELLRQLQSKIPTGGVIGRAFGSRPTR
jgi:hypothetical protein